MCLFLFRVHTQDYQVKNFRAVNKNQTAVELAWNNPTKVNLTRLKLSYTIQEQTNQTNKTFYLSRYSESYVCDGLLPGSLVNFFLTTIVGEEEKETATLTLTTCKFPLFFHWLVTLT